MNKKKNSFDLEGSLERLQKIVESLESDETKIRDAVRLYEESIGLVQQCISELSAVRSHISELKENAEASFQKLTLDE